MPDDGDERREKVRSVLQELGPPDGQSPASILTGWVIVAEWMDPEGEKYLVRAWDHTLAKWSANGMLHEVLYGDFSD